MIGALLFGSFAVALHLLPRPSSVSVVPSCSAPPPHAIAASFDAGARREIDERWSALGAGTLHVAREPDIVVRHDAALPAQAYRLWVGRSGAIIWSSGSDGAFYAAMTLAQLPERAARGWRVPCVRIDDRPALRWRVLSDDVSRGPLPTMRYFEERIRTIAAFKMNGYSPYMEHVFVSPTDPLPAPLDGITPAQLRALARYARIFHVALIPEQQTFAHMHNTLKIERYAGAAEFPHGFLLSPASARASAYLARIIRQELAAVPHPPFFHIGSDETATLGQGTTAAFVATHGGRSRVYADHVNAMARLIAPSGARVMLWDDGIENDPSIMRMIERKAVIVNWHYDAEPSFEKYIRLIASGGFAQMVAPGASNWNEIYPDIATAIANERRFIDEGKAAHVLGLFQTVWHDDGETLYEATWYPVLYAASAAWERRDSDPARFRRDFPAAFFGIDDPRYGDDVAELGDALTRLNAAHAGPSDALFWGDPFDRFLQDRLSHVDLRAVRLEVERAETHLLLHRPPLHANAAAVMFLAARRYDVLAREYQIGREVRDDYASPSFRSLLWSTYWMWELRDDFEELAPLYERAWRYESRPSHLASNLERYHLAAGRAIERADALARVTRENFLQHQPLPPLDDVIALPRGGTQP
ncbi:MAG TPA: glycoside hydrolase family 20 zincin-like fold domain-containing protein [Candidatus Dormibacteraeota bacterium]|nr:glycoside hydrolase family 20 zincin-like fold domain-containing protein [Candidatus Dormibacteraeota bacterium]